jgi:purine-binding chemotaxis protein CheW
MPESSQLVVFTLDDQQYALELANVERVVRAVEITHLPDAPDSILGVINFEGRVIPVVNTRKRLGLAERDLELHDLFIIARDHGRSVAFVGDEVKPVLEMQVDQVISAEKVLPRAGYVEGVAKVDQGMILILAVSKVLSLEERRQLQTAMAGM